MSQVKPKVFLPGGLASLCTEYKKLRDIVNSQIEVVSDEDLVSNPGIGTEITAALFYVHDPLKLQVFNRKEEGLLPALHLVCNNGVGVDHMPFSRMKQLGLRLTNTPGVLSDATADMAMALMLATGRQLGTGKMNIQNYMCQHWSHDHQKLFHMSNFGVSHLTYNILHYNTTFNVQLFCYFHYVY